MLDETYGTCYELKCRDRKRIRGDGGYIEKSVALIKERERDRKRKKIRPRLFYTARDIGVGKQRERTRHVDPARSNTVGNAEETEEMRKRRNRESTRRHFHSAVCRGCARSWTCFTPRRLFLPAWQALRSCRYKRQAFMPDYESVWRNHRPPCSNVSKFHVFFFPCH